MREYLALERCNFASNIAYYRAAVRVCEYPDWHWGEDYSRAIKQGFVTLATGSGFMHMSHTSTGGSYDNSMIAVIIYVAYQAVLDKLGAQSNFLRGLDDSTRIDARELASKIVRLPLHSEPHQWNSEMNKLEKFYPREYWYTFGALWSLVYEVTMPFWMSEKVLLWVADTINLAKMKKSAYNFLFNRFYPESKSLVENVRINFWQVPIILSKFIGVLMKIGWAFVWQEKITDGVAPHSTEWLYSKKWYGPLIDITPIWNWFSTLLTGFA